MKKTVFILLLLCLTSLSFAQERFYHIYEGWQANCIFEADSLFQIIGKDAISPGAHELLCLQVSKSTAAQEDIFTFSFDDYNSTSSTALSGSSMLFNNYVYSVGGVIVSDNEYLPYFVKMDYL